jgi:hypothetical protein
MVNSTFRSRLVQLLQRSRKAVRLYSSVSKVKPPETNQRFAELQANEWKIANAELLKLLSRIMDVASGKSFVRDVVGLRDRFYRDWRDAEAELHSKQCALVFAAENGDFIRSALMSEQLVIQKARMQARQAVHHEIDQVLRQSRQIEPSLDPQEDVPETEVVFENMPSFETEQSNNVIPLRRKRI